MKTMKWTILSVSMFAISTLFVGTAHAEGQWAKKHPRQAQVKRRDNRLKKKTANAENSGKITQAQGQKLQNEETAINNERKADAAANGGHITRGEQAQMNRQENHVNQQLHHDEKMDSQNAAGTTPPPAGSN